MMNGNKVKLKKAPFLDQQSDAPHSEIIALIGSKAWVAWGKGKSEDWRLLSQYIHAENNYKPIILGPSQLAEISQLRLANNNHEQIRFCVFGKLSEPQKTAVLLNIAKNSDIETVVFCDNLGQTQENLSQYITRLRKDEQSQDTAQQIAKLASTANLPKTSPYIDYREVNNIQGLYYIVPKVDKDTGEVLREEEKWLCDHFELLGEGYTTSGESFYIFQWLHPDTKENVIEPIPLADFGSADGWKMLKRQGLKMTSKGYINNLADHFHHNGDHQTKWTVAESTGWQNGAYLLPSGEIIGSAEKPVIFLYKNKNTGENGYCVQGDIASWQQNIARYVAKNYSMMLAVATSFAAPLLKIINADSFGVHLYDDSTKGKTTALNIANSIWGNPEKLKRSWDNTPTAIMTFANAQNDGLLTLDELGQAQKITDVENAAYKLFNETGRGRGNKDGGLQEIHKWKITALSTGEIDLEGFLSAKGIDIKAGQLVRLLNIPMIEADQLHGFDNNKAHADHINAECANNYGAVGRAWIEYLLENKDTVKNEYKRLNEIWQKRVQNMAAQIQRVASRFAILETALNLASHLTLWSIDDNREAILSSWNDWLAIFGTRSRTETQIIEHVNGWLLENADSRFYEYPDDPNKKPRDPVGYHILENPSKGEYEKFYVYVHSFKKHIKGNFNLNQVLETLHSVKMTTDEGANEKDRPYQHKLSKKIDKNQPRCYVLYRLDESD
ncbi:MAG: DUF927 domain-containing protein [Pasteurellaceae bacterium]|nr:DUF927 domain-containing protein [Pasteurellaceae bacterium]